jgi:hypothetical protein
VETVDKIDLYAGEGQCFDALRGLMRLKPQGAA